MTNNELAAYVLEVALTYSKDAYPAGDHVIRMPWQDSPSRIRISVDIVSSVEYRFADGGERMDMQDFIQARMAAFMEGLKNGSQKFEMDIEFPCEIPRF